MNEVLLKHLRTLKTDEERQLCYESLAFIGMKYYFSMHPFDSSIRLESVHSLARDYYHELRLQMKPKVSIPKPPSNQAPGHHGSKYRPEALAHYPFVDHGSVSDIFNDRPRSRPNLLNMGAPGRKRFIAHVFETMRFDRTGIRLSDVPEALDMVGIVLPGKLRRLFERTRSKEVHGALKDILDSTGKQMSYTERYITFIQWKRIIRNFLLLQHDGREFQTLDDMLSNELRNHRKINDLDLDSDPDEDAKYQDGTLLEENKPYLDAWQKFQWAEENENDQQKRRRNDEEADDQEEEEDDDEESDNEESEDTYDRQFQKNRPKNAVAHSKSYFKNLKNVKSRLSDVIRHDKKVFRQNKADTEDKALTAIARKRLQEIASKPKHKSIHDPHFFEDSKAPKNLSALKQTEKNIRKMKDLNSGLAALQIADSFLSSKVGKEFVSKAELDDLEDISPAEADMYVTKILDKVTHAPAADVSSSHRQTDKKKNLLSKNESLMNTLNNNIADPELRETMAIQSAAPAMKDAKEYYSSGWKSAKGGWVADFGPAHTHAYYTGPELAKNSLHHDDPLLQDEMLKSMAKDVFSPRTKNMNLSTLNDPMLSPAGTAVSNKNNNNDLRDQSANETFFDFPASASRKEGGATGFNTTGQFNDFNATKSHQFADFSESSMSLDPAIAGAGAGAKGMFAGLSDDSNDEILLSKLQESVSLKNIAGNKDETS